MSVEHVKILDNPQVIELFKETGSKSPPVSMDLDSNKSGAGCKNKEPKKSKCACCNKNEASEIAKSDDDPAQIAGDVEELLKNKEAELRALYDTILNKEITRQSERFDYILQCEQMRTSYMLREAHRERKEKIKALESQLENKNLAALMYVMCTERARSKLEKLRLIEDYSQYISGLQDLLRQGQQLIFHLSRGYKTAARVDHEWREKMKKVVNEFMSFIYHFAGGPTENNQYFINLPKLLKCDAPTVDDPDEDPFETDEEVEENVSYDNGDQKQKLWYERLDGNDHPFVVFGDMCDFAPPQRREVLKAVKAAKTAPKVWKEYVFNEKFVHRDCENADRIKDVFPHYKGPLPSPNSNLSYASDRDVQSGRHDGLSKISFTSRQRTVSTEFRGDMGSLLKIMTSTNQAPHSADKAALLGARDSMEITSTTKLRHISTSRGDTPKTWPSKMTKIDIKKRDIPAGFDELIEDYKKEQKTADLKKLMQSESLKTPDQDASYQLGLGSLHTDSLTVLPKHVPEKDHKINYEKICPEERCHRLKVDSFMQSLPDYMRANPFTHFEQNFEEYEPCTPEQLKLLKERLEAKAKKGTEEEPEVEAQSPLKEWETGVATQTSEFSLKESLSCTCQRHPTPADSNFVFDIHDLIPVKQTLNLIQKECLFDDNIQFDRFKVIGRDSKDSRTRNEIPTTSFRGDREKEIAKILKKHPSLLDIFQANTH